MDTKWEFHFRLVWSPNRTLCISTKAWMFIGSFFSAKWYKNGNFKNVVWEIASDISGSWVSIHVTLIHLRQIKSDAYEFNFQLRGKKTLVSDMVDKKSLSGNWTSFLFLSIKLKEMNCANGLRGTLWATGHRLVFGWINSNNLNIAANLILGGEQACDLWFHSS